MTTQAETRVRLAARMYEFRDAAKRLGGDGYEARIAEGKRLIAGLAKAWRCSPMEVLPKLSRECKSDRKPLDSLAILWLTAATVELIEGENHQKQEG